MNEKPQAKASEQFVKAMKQILSVPKKEILRREANYQKQRKTKKAKV